MKGGGYLPPGGPEDDVRMVGAGGLGWAWVVFGWFWGDDGCRVRAAAKGSSKGTSADRRHIWEASSRVAPACGRNSNHDGAKLPEQTTLSPSITNPPPTTIGTRPPGLQGRRGEQAGPTGHQYLKRQIWSVGAKNKTHGVSSHASSFPGLESRF